jgi:catechol 2,3-dioxygenase-like lactoylglutathione lyase family enzyme
MNQGIKHVEIAVSDLQKSLSFYDTFFKTIGWRKVDKNGFVGGNTKVYLKQWSFPSGNTLGARHICFWADDREMVDEVGKYVKGAGVKMIRGPLVVTEYSPDYYTVDFYDPDGYMLEVAHTPN